MVNVKTDSAIRVFFDSFFLNIVQQPKLSPFIDEMKENISGDLKIDKDDISIKAKTTEYLGFTGRKEGIAALAVTTLYFYINSLYYFKTNNSIQRSSFIYIDV